MLLADHKVSRAWPPRIGFIEGELPSSPHFRELLHFLRTKVLSTYADAIKVAMVAESTQTNWRKNVKA